MKQTWIAERVPWPGPYSTAHAGKAPLRNSSTAGEGCFRRHRGRRDPGRTHRAESRGEATPSCVIGDRTRTSGKTYAHPGHFAGVATVILALDADDAGQEGRRRLWLDLTARGIDVLVLPASALAGAKDLGEYWQCHHAIPVQLTARVTGPHMQCAPATPMEAENPHARPGEALWATLPILEELRQRTAEDRVAAHYVLWLATASWPDDLGGMACSMM